MKYEDPLGIGFYIPKRILLILAGLIWCFAGYNVLRVGLLSSDEEWHISGIVIAGVVFVLFLLMFIHIVRKNRVRIMAFQADRVGIFNALTGKGYFMMVGMMTLGLWLRYAEIMPMSWLRIFYTGLGAALTAAGLLFLVEYIRSAFGAKSKKNGEEKNGEEKKTTD
ncbi:MAG: hypothetical protein FWF88_12750 [Peptococcaceae bacterium]|nr:hypothetical protein [Peptococcaceae bacterium]